MNDAWEGRVHRALVHAAGDAAPRRDPPDPDAIWDAVRGRLPSRQAQAVIDAAVLDPAAYEELRVALALAAELDEGEARARHRDDGRALGWGAMVLAVAAALLAVVTLRPRAEPVELGPVEYRDAPTLELRSLVPAEAALPRDAFVLAWELVEGARYTIRVSTEQPRVIAHKTGLREPSFQVPAALLAGLPSGTRILWQVEVLGADAQRERSATFVNVVK